MSSGLKQTKNFIYFIFWTGIWVRFFSFRKPILNLNVNMYSFGINSGELLKYTESQQPSELAVRIELSRVFECEIQCNYKRPNSSNYPMYWYVVCIWVIVKFLLKECLAFHLCVKTLERQKKNISIDLNDNAMEKVFCYLMRWQTTKMLFRDRKSKLSK